MASSRDIDIVHAILRNPRTARMIYSASAMFERPYTNFTQVKSDLRNLFDEDVLGRVEVPSDKSGRCEFLYHVKTGAKKLVPELKPFKAGNTIFKAPATSPHAIFVAECISHLERSIGEYKHHIELLETRRDGRFTAKIALTTVDGTQITHLIPDGVFLVDISGTVNLFFLELQNRVRAIDSVSRDSISKTFKEKLMKYKAFQQEFRYHPFIRDAESLYGVSIPGFRVLIVTTKDEFNRNRLVSCAHSMGYGEMFHFTTMDELRQENIFTSPMWSLTTLDKNRKVALVDSKFQNRYHL